MSGVALHKDEYVCCLLMQPWGIMVGMYDMKQKEGRQKDQV